MVGMCDYKLKAYLKFKAVIRAERRGSDRLPRRRSAYNIGALRLRSGNEHPSLRSARVFLFHWCSRSAIQYVPLMSIMQKDLCTAKHATPVLALRRCQGEREDFKGFPLCPLVSFRPCSMQAFVVKRF